MSTTKQLTKKEIVIATIFTLLFTFVFLPFFFSLGGESAPKKEVKKDINDCIDAYVTSQTFVENILKSPSTAKFGVGKKHYTCIDYKDDSFWIKSYVASQNSFGATIRSEYINVLRYQLNTDDWYSEYLLFDGTVYYDDLEK